MENKMKVLTYAGAGIIVLLLIGLFLAIGSNQRNKKNLDAERLASEKLLSEKLIVEKELARLKADFSALDEKNSANAKLLEETNLKIAENQRRINSISGENRSLRNAKKELDELQKIKEELEKEASQIKSDYQKLLAQGQEMQNKLSSLEEEKKNLTLELEKERMYNTDNFLVTATRGKKTEKVVVCASRTKKLNMTFVVPQNLTEALSFKITTPSGTTINPDDKALSWKFSRESADYTASLSAVSGQFENSREVSLTYAAKEKLIAGEYKIEILCNGSNIGNCRIKLK